MPEEPAQPGTPHQEPLKAPTPVDGTPVLTPASDDSGTAVAPVEAVAAEVPQQAPPVPPAASVQQAPQQAPPVPPASPGQQAAPQVRAGQAAPVQQPPQGPGGQPPGWPQQRPIYWTQPPPPPRPGFFETRWKGPSTVAGKAAVLGTAAGAIAAAVAVPLDRPGVGWLISAAVAAGAVGVVARTAGASVAGGDRIARALWGLAALALLGVGTFRAAGWLFFCCLLAALGCASLAAAGGRSMRAMTVGAVSVPLAALRSIPWISKGVGALLVERSAAKKAEAAADPVTAAKKDDGGARGARIFLAVVVTIVLLLIFGGLLASADDAFAELLGRPIKAIAEVFEDLDLPTIFVWTLLLVTGGLFTAGGIFLVTAPPDLHRMENPGKARIGGFEFALPLGALVVLFGGFVAVQFTVLFADKTNVLRTAGVTYADYARSGFRQLIIVTVLTLIVIAASARWARRETPKDRLLLRILLGGVASLSLVIVSSAIYRLWLYQDYRGWTRERIFVGAVEIGLGLIFVIILLAGIQLKAEWLPRAVAGTAVVMLLALAVINPERFMAEQNVARYERSHKIIDLFYLRALSADATPALAGLPPEMRKCALSQIARELKNDPDTWYSWNYSREQARQVIADLGPGAVGTCQDAFRFDNERG